MSREVLQQTYTLSEANVKDLIGWLRAGQINRALIALEHLNPAEPAQPVQPEQEPVLQDIEQYRMQMAGISTAALGYWKDGDGIHPDYDTVELRDVAKLYAKYDALYKARWAAQPEQGPVAWRTFDGEGGYEYRTYDMNEQYAEGWEQRNPKHKDWVEPLFTSPPQRQPLTDEELHALFDSPLTPTGVQFARAIEAAHGIGDKT